MTSFDEDSFKWSKEQAEFIQQKQWDKVDHKYVASVITIDGDEIHYRLEGLVILWIEFMLKIDCYPEYTSENDKWISVVKNCKTSIKNILESCPSLYKEIEESLGELYIEAQTMVCIELEESLI